MALLSIENFIAPLKNKGQLITLVVIVFVFAVFRWQGGGVEIRDTGDAHSPQATDINTEIDAYGGQEKAENPSEYGTPRRHIIDEMMAEDNEAQEYSLPSESASQGTGDSGSADSLDELERMVGLK